ncbi:MAG: peptidoglycan DD-metalloendopeptidase family protein [Bacteroidota bacterium]
MPGDALAAYRLRDGRGLEPCPQTLAIAAWLAENRGAPIVTPDPSTAPVLVFDFSTSSTEWAADALSGPMLASEEIERRMREAAAEVGVGRYDEVRGVYTAAQFQTAGEARTVHLGLDLFQPAGVPVFAPLGGTVHSFADNALPLDYGPTVILEHRPDGCPPFWTLYGHLSRASLRGLAEGDSVEAGQRIGALGTPEENGGWAPHLHVQLITDLLGRRGDFPGVGTAEERSVWTSLCPDPNLLLRIPASAFHGARSS